MRTLAGDEPVEYAVSSICTLVMLWPSRMAPPMEKKRPVWYSSAERVMSRSLSKA
jgi:hypothetical protein